MENKRNTRNKRNNKTIHVNHPITVVYLGEVLYRHIKNRPAAIGLERHVGPHGDYFFPRLSRRIEDVNPFCTWTNYTAQRHQIPIIIKNRDDRMGDSRGAGGATAGTTGGATSGTTAGAELDALGTNSCAAVFK